METIKARASALAAYVCARFGERSTLILWVTSAPMGLGLPYPINLFYLLALFAAGMVPDGTVLPKKTNA